MKYIIFLSIGILLGSVACKKKTPSSHAYADAGIFRIGTTLGLRVGICGDEICRELFLDVQENAGVSEQFLFNGLTLREDKLRIGNKLTQWLNSSFFEGLSTQNGIIGVPLECGAEEKLQDLRFTVEIIGISVQMQMQLGTYGGLNKEGRLHIQNLEKFTKLTTITKTMGSTKENKYFLLLHLLLSEVKEIHDKMKSGAALKLKIIAQAKGFPQEVKTLQIVWES